jgi:hypothetical protein
MGTVVLSIDVGIRNMAACRARVEKGEEGVDQLSVEHWGVHEVEGRKGTVELISSVVEWMDGVHGGADMVLVEQQVSAKMRSIQAAIVTYCKVKGIRVAVVSPRAKLLGVKRLSYPERKRFAVARTVERLEMGEFQEEFDAVAKKDDMCDAFMQMFAYLSRGKKARPLRCVCALKRDDKCCAQPTSTCPTMPTTSTSTCSSPPGQLPLGE